MQAPTWSQGKVSILEECRTQTLTALPPGDTAAGRESENTLPDFPHGEDRQAQEHLLVWDMTEFRLSVMSFARWGSTEFLRNIPGEAMSGQLSVSSAGVFSFCPGVLCLAFAYSEQEDCGSLCTGGSSRL